MLQIRRHAGQKSAAKAENIFRSCSTPLSPPPGAESSNYPAHLSYPSTSIGEVALHSTDGRQAQVMHPDIQGEEAWVPQATPDNSPVRKLTIRDLVNTSDGQGETKRLEASAEIKSRGLSPREDEANASVRSHSAGSSNSKRASRSARGHLSGGQKRESHQAATTVLRANVSKRHKPSLAPSQMSWRIGVLPRRR